MFVLQAMASPEDKAYEIMRELDVGYVLVIFGGLTGYSSDGNNSSSSFESVSYCSTMFIKHGSECCESLKD